VDWRKTTLEDAEARHPGLLRPSSLIYRDWQALKAARQPGDEIFSFFSAPISWQTFCGRGGFALLRAGKVVREVVIILN
jgi:hypothetical protein